MNAEERSRLVAELRHYGTRLMREAAALIEADASPDSARIYSIAERDLEDRLAKSRSEVASLHEEVERLRFISLRCSCTAPLAIRVDTIPHGLLAGWKCGACGRTSMLSDIATITEGWEAGRDFHSPKYKLFHPEDFPPEVVAKAKRELGLRTAALDTTQERPSK